MWVYATENEPRNPQHLVDIEEGTEGVFWVCEVCGSGWPEKGDISTHSALHHCWDCLWYGRVVIGENGIPTIFVEGDDDDDTLPKDFGEPVYG